MPPIRVVLADPHDLARLALRRLLEETGEFTVCGETDSGVAMVRLQERFRPRLLVVALTLCDMGVAQALRVMSGRERPFVLAMVRRGDHPGMPDAVRAGVRGFVEVGSAVREVIEAARVVASGGRWWGKELGEEAFLAAINGTQAAELDPLAPLTPREREVFLLVSSGYTNPEIAQRLHISARTIEAHRARSLRKLGIGTLAEAIRFAATHGFLHALGS